METTTIPVNHGMPTLGVIGTRNFPKDGIEYVVKNLCQHMREGMGTEEWERYKEQTTDLGRIQLFLGRKEIQSTVQNLHKLHPGGKDKEKAILLKSAGNKAFGNGDNEKALSLYTFCLAWMPHDGSKDVPVVYANRSAALLYLEEYKLAKRDAELAFTLNYPKELHYKLLERVGRCLLQLGQGEKAVKKFHAAIKALDDSGLDEQKMKKTKRVLEDLVKQAPHVHAGHGFRQNGEFGSVGQGESPSTLPDVAGGCGKYLRTASSRLTLQYREKQGRFVVANDLFRPGDVVLVEKPFVSVLNPEHYHRQCFQCYAPMKAPIVCESCIFASFCSGECREKSKVHHQYECSILGLLKNSGISVICNMGVRILTQNGPESILAWIEEEKDTLNISHQPGNLSPDRNSNKSKVTTLGFVEEYRTDQSAFFNLVTHSEKRTPEDFLHQIIMTLYLLEALKTTSYFDALKKPGAKQGSCDKSQKASVPSGPSAGCEKEDRGSDEPEQVSSAQNGCFREGHISQEVELKFAVLLLRSLKALQFNVHETSGWDADRDKDHSVGIGGAVYPTLALFNHSCNPAVIRYFINDTVVVRAVRTILPGEMVAENYGPSYATSPRQERQARLQDYYWFQCECIACREDWITFDKMTSAETTMKFRCENCRTYICKSDENMGILFKCGKCGKSVNILKALKSVHETDAKYAKAVNFINNGQQESGLGMMLETLFQLETFLMPPFKEYHMCQEYIRRCYLSQGNQISKLPEWDPENPTIAPN